ncbi:uncharacterized protein PV06_10792 [Exophiala oligosperma]|uniref:Uncharacterized protein n=1 Tax=Exophiala oligosperma TaxID=215243 RepID=A0A0D2D1I6_9EURO|nr:uncharacterized protein PV06_10792 [Exophiala oligosperma]KIW37173.1 hypothetical protein PV06_10792 [Exophiala oligosperma]
MCGVHRYTMIWSTAQSSGQTLLTGCAILLSTMWMDARMDDLHTVLTFFWWRDPIDKHEPSTIHHRLPWLACLHKVCGLWTCVDFGLVMPQSLKKTSLFFSR